MKITPLLFPIGFCILFLFHSTLLLSQDQVGPKKPDDSETFSSAPTEITAETMDFDLENRKANFSGNVKVVDEKLNLKADEMIIQFDENQKLEKIEAKGNVVIVSEGNTASGGVAVYDFKIGKITLSNSPVLKQGPNRVVGAVSIVYDRKLKKFSTEGGQPQILAFESGEGDSILELLKSKDNEGD